VGGQVPYLAFADDTVIFTRVSRLGRRRIHQFLKLYQSVSGQKVNEAKSSFICSSKATPAQVNLIAGTLGFRREHLPITYLGAPLAVGKRKRVLFDGILAKVRSRILGWSSKFLSSGGKIILIKHVLTSIPIFLLQVLSPPKSFLVALGRMLNGFLWNQSADQKRIHWKSWEKLSFPVQEGGLGFRSFSSVVDAFSMKLWWRLRLNDSMWASFMHQKSISGSHPLHVRRKVGSTGLATLFSYERYASYGSFLYLFIAYVLDVFIGEFFS